MSTNLTKEVKKRLAEFAAAITAPDYAPGAPGKGLSVEQLQERGITSCKGKPLQAGAVYVANHPPSVNHARRLETAYVRGGWPAVERYLQPFLTPEARARKAAEAAGGAPAAADFAPLAEAADEQPVPVATDEPEVPAGLAFLAACEDAGGPEALAAAAGPVVMGLDFNTAPASTTLVAEFFSAGLDGPISPEAECLLAQSAAAVDAQLQALLPEVQVPAGWALARSADGQPAGTFEPLPLTSADEVQTELRTCGPRPEATDAQLLGQLYEAGHAGSLAGRLFPLAEQCGPCRGECGICEQVA